MTHLCTRQIERRVLLSENSSVVSTQWGPGMSDGILKLIKIRLGEITFLAIINLISPILH
jgi:hypothetical protein